jgi:hypothetical protein
MRRMIPLGETIDNSMKHEPGRSLRLALRIARLWRETRATQCIVPDQWLPIHQLRRIVAEKTHRARVAGATRRPIEPALQEPLEEYERFSIVVTFPVDSELSCPVLVAQHMSASSAFVLLWAGWASRRLVHAVHRVSPPSGFKRRFSFHRVA